MDAHVVEVEPYDFEVGFGRPENVDSEREEEDRECVDEAAPETVAGGEVEW